MGNGLGFLVGSPSRVLCEAGQLIPPSLAGLDGAKQVSACLIPVCEVKAHVLFI